MNAPEPPLYLFVKRDLREISDPVKAVIGTHDVAMMPTMLTFRGQSSDKTLYSVVDYARVETALELAETDRVNELETGRQPTPLRRSTAISGSLDTALAARGGDLVFEVTTGGHIIKQLSLEETWGPNASNAFAFLRNLEMLHPTDVALVAAQGALISKLDPDTLNRVAELNDFTGRLRTLWYDPERALLTAEIYRHGVASFVNHTVRTMLLAEHLSPVEYALNTQPARALFGQLPGDERYLVRGIADTFDIEWQQRRGSSSLSDDQRKELNDFIRVRQLDNNQLEPHPAHQLTIGSSYLSPRLSKALLNTLAQEPNQQTAVAYLDLCGQLLDQHIKTVTNKNALTKVITELQTAAGTIFRRPISTHDLLLTGIVNDETAARIQSLIEPVAQPHPVHITKAPSADEIRRDPTTTLQRFFKQQENSKEIVHSRAYQASFLAKALNEQTLLNGRTSLTIDPGETTLRSLISGFQLFESTKFFQGFPAPDGRALAETEQSLIIRLLINTAECECILTRRNAAREQFGYNIFAAAGIADPTPSQAKNASHTAIEAARVCADWSRAEQREFFESELDVVHPDLGSALAKPQLTPEDRAVVERLIDELGRDDGMQPGLEF